VLGYVTWAKEPALKDKGITLNTMFQRNYRPQKGLVLVFVYFDGQFSMLRSVLATLLQSEATKRIFNLQFSMVTLPLGACNAFTKRSD